VQGTDDRLGEGVRVGKWEADFSTRPARWSTAGDHFSDAAPQQIQFGIHGREVGHATFDSHGSPGW